MWELTIFWTDATKTKEQYFKYEQATKAIEYFIIMAKPRIRHFKLKYRGDQNE